MSKYDEMPAGPEMDCLIAEKVMGWKQVFRDWEYCARVFNKYGQPILDVENVGRGFDCLEEVIFRPSVDVGHAWEVMDKLATNRDNIAVTNVKRENEWQCGISRPTLCEPFVWTAQADTAPLAICRAALKATDPT